MQIYGKSSAILKLILITLVCISAGIFVDMGAATEDLDVITIDNEGYNKDRKGPVLFEHKMHAYDYEITCWQCHHEYEDGENIWSPWGTTKRCIECHDPLTSQGNAFNLQKAYHVNCKNCHKEMKIFGEKSIAYRECNTCHESD